MGPSVRRLLSGLLLLPALAFAQEHESGEDPMAVARILGVDPNALFTVTSEQRAQAKAIGHEAVCLCGTCPRQTITACTCGWAHTHQKTIEAALVAGKSRDDILGAYMTAHGPKAFPTPPGPYGAITWMVPYAGGLVALGAFFLFGLRMRRRHAALQAVENQAKRTDEAPAPAFRDEDRAKLSRELEDLD
jgi:cytochrome c-type biogenesis protein CcmH/NrfF